MSFTNCIQDGVAEGKISQAEADNIKEQYELNFQEKTKSMSPADAAFEAQKEITESIKYEKLLKRRQKLLQVAAIKKLLVDEAKFKNAFGQNDEFDFLEAIYTKDNYSNISSLEQRIDATTQLYLSDINEFLWNNRKKVGGFNRNKAQQNNIVKSMLGEKVDDAAAVEMGKALGEVFEKMRLRFNKLGGNIGKLEGGYFPVTHNAFAVRNTDMTEWIEFTKKHIAWDKMIDNKTGLPFTDGTITIALRDVYQSIRSEGYNKRTPGGALQGKSKANTRSDHRFLQWKDANAFLAYNEKFGVGEPFDIAIAHVKSMSKDIAMMERLGTNPNATHQFLKDRLMNKYMNEGTDKQIAKANKIANRMDGYYGMLNGTLNTNINTWWGNSMAGLRSMLTAAQLGGAFISAVSDINFQRMTRSMNGLPQINTISAVLKQMNPLKFEERAKAAVRLGLIADGLTTIAMHQQRMLGEVNAPEIANRIADGVLRVSLLNQWTTAGRWAFGMEFLGFMADNSKTAYKDLNPKFRNTLNKYGIEEGKWDILRNTKTYTHEGAEFFDINTLANRSDLTEDLREDLAKQVLEMINVETNFAVPSASLKGRFMVGGEAQAGTLSGEIMKSILMYKNFGVTLIFTHMMRGMSQTSLTSKAEYFASFLIGTTVMGAGAMQLKEMAKGRDPRDMTDYKFWGAAMLQGGGLGIFGDFLNSNVNRYDSSISKTLVGSVGAFYDDAARLTVGNLYELANGKDTNIVDEGIRFFSKYTPGSSLWYSRLAMERMVIDQLRLWNNPGKTKKSFRKREKRYKKDYGQKFWWKPGQTSPNRNIDFEAAIGN
jgi:hypothetical protein